MEIVNDTSLEDFKIVLYEVYNFMYNIKFHLFGIEFSLWGLFLWGFIGGVIVFFLHKFLD